MTDYIDRQAAIKAIDDLPNCYNGYSDAYDKACIIGVLEELPPAEVEPVKRGKWVLNDRHIYECSECGLIPTQEEKDYWHYCPNCGAKMENEDGNENI